MSTPKITPPPDPDPDPTAKVESQSAANAEKQARKKAAGNYGRRKTILAGDSTPASAERKNILG